MCRLSSCGRWNPGELQSWKGHGNLFLCLLTLFLRLDIDDGDRILCALLVSLAVPRRQLFLSVKEEFAAHWMSESHDTLGWENEVFGFTVGSVAWSVFSYSREYCTKISWAGVGAC